MKTSLLLLPILLLVGCGQYRLALSPNQCTAPTDSEAKITKSVWMPKEKRIR